MEEREKKRKISNIEHFSHQPQSLTSTTIPFASPGPYPTFIFQTQNMKRQKVCFIRHGVAKHNLPDPKTKLRPNLEDPALFDPQLVYQGKHQALEAGERLKTWWKATQLGEHIQLVICSPLTRCIQTAMIAFLPGDYAANDDRCNKEPRMVCTEMVREAYGMHYPDKRRNASILKTHWPMLEFDSSMTESDEAWSPTSRETLSVLEERITTFLSALVQRPETNIVVVTHGVWIEACLNQHCPEALDHGRQRVYNCDIFIGDCVSEEGKFTGLQNMRLLK